MTSPPLAKLVALGAALLSTGALGACSTDDLHPDVTILGDASADSAMSIYVVREDAYTADLVPRNLAPYRVRVDGRLVAYDTRNFVLVGSNACYGLTLPAGEHVVSLVDDQGRTAVISPTVETRPGLNPSAPVFGSAIVFFGGPNTMQARAFLDDPAALPAGSIHARVMNALADHQPVQVVQCPTALDGSRTYTGGECTPIGDPIAYGEVFETDATPDVVAKLGFYWAAPGAVNPVVAPANLSSQTLTSGFITRIPTMVQGAANSCPSCIFTEF
jgi:hypothetical protein